MRGSQDCKLIESPSGHELFLRPIIKRKCALYARRYFSFILILSLVLLQAFTNQAFLTADSAPKITIQPNDLVAIEGESVELNCDAEGWPTPTIEWYHNGQLVRSSSQSRSTMGGSIQFLDILASESDNGSKQTDTGIYHCLAKNSLGIARSRNASLQVAYIRPDFKAAPRDKLANIGETVTFDCLPQAWPEPSIKWRHNGHLIDSAGSGQKYSINRIAKVEREINNANSSASLDGKGNANLAPNGGQLLDLFGSQLVIRQVDKMDEGSYSCLVETKGTHKLIERESPIAKLSAMVKPYFIEAPEHRTVQVGAQVKLRCRLGGDPEPVISWRKQDGQPLSEKTQIDPLDKTLIIEQLTVADQAAYVCEGENPLGSVRAVASVTVTSPPRFTQKPDDLEVDQGASVQLKCAGEASPQPLQFWYKEGHRQLMFPAAQTQQQQQATTQIIQKQTQNSILDWPQAAPLTYSEPEFRSQGNSQSDTSPAINKLFTSIGADQFSAADYASNQFGIINRIHVDNRGTLNILNATTSDTGYYACALISSVGSVMTKAKLTVRQSPTSEPLFDPYNSNSASASGLSSTSGYKFDLLPPPVIKLGAANQTLPTNTSAQLVCEVVSQVTYKLQWFFDALPLQDEPPRVVVLETGVLSINNLKISDSGIYTCVVTAVDQNMPLASPSEPLELSMLTSAPPTPQSTTHSTMLKVASPMNPNIQFYRMDTFAYPSSPGPAYLVSTNGNDAITIAWSPPTDSGTLPIKEYIIEHYDTSQEHYGWTVIYKVKGKESLLIGGLSGEGSHFFVVRAANSHGIGPSSAIAGPMRTHAGETKYQFELQRRKAPLDSRKSHFDYNNLRSEINLARDRLMTITTSLLSSTPVSSTSIRLQWSTQVTGNSSGMPNYDTSLNYPPPDVTNFLEGYSIRYRAKGLGESLQSRDPLFGNNWNVWPMKDNSPMNLPLVTSYIDEQEDYKTRLSRRSHELVNSFDYRQEFSEVKVADSTEHYTINSLRPFTLYEFFVVPYYKDIDGVPSNILTAQTNEDRPTVAPPNLTIRPINNTAVRLLWFHLPPLYSSGIIRGYVARVNRSDISPNIGSSDQYNPQAQLNSELSSIIDIPMGVTGTYSLKNGIGSETSSNFRFQQETATSSAQQYVLMYDISNLTFKSFYSIQLAASTSVGHGPWSEPLNFIMDPKILSQTKISGNDFEDVLSKSLISSIPQTFGNPISSSDNSRIYLLISLMFIFTSIISSIGFLLYRRNNQKVTTWKKAISEHFTNKFYMPSSVDPRATNSMQQNIYDHQQHLIYSGSAHIPQTQVQTQPIWTNNGCLNSSRTGSLSSHGGLLPISNDPSVGVARQVILMNNTSGKDSKFSKNQLVAQQSIDSGRSLNLHQGQIVQHTSDYYSVINGVAEYEELDSHQRGTVQQIMTNGERHQTASSNSDTSCPSSVTRLIPNQNYSRDLISKTFGDGHRHEMVLQQQIDCYNNNGGKQPFATMINNEGTRLQSIIPLSPYATTNLTNQVPKPQHLFSNPAQVSLIDHSRQQNFVAHNSNGMSSDDSSKALMNSQQYNGIHNSMSAFRTLQRNPLNFQPSRGQQFSQTSLHHQPQQVQPQLFMQADGARFQNNQAHSYIQQQSNVTNITPNPLGDLKLNLYERIHYSDSPSGMQQQQHQHLNQKSEPPQRQLFQNPSNDIISSSTSSGSMKSSPDQQQQTNLQTKYSRKGSTSANNCSNNQSSSVDSEKEAHDLHVFSSQHSSQNSEMVNEQQQLHVVGGSGGKSITTDGDWNDDEDINQADESTAFKQKDFSQSDNQKTRQLSKRKRQQQRNRLHNNSQNQLG